MRIQTAAWRLVCILLVSGCAIHPQPKDVTGVSTFAIEQQIRCETRKAVIDLTLTYAATRPGDFEGSYRSEGNRSKILCGIPGRSGRRHDPEPEHVHRREFVRPLASSGPPASPTISSWTWPRSTTPTAGSMSEACSADAPSESHSKQGSTALGRIPGLSRSPTILASSSRSVTGCKDRIVGPNYIYPISGEIGVIDMIKEFVYMSIFGNLGGETENCRDRAERPADPGGLASVHDHNIGIGESACRLRSSRKGVRRHGGQRRSRSEPHRQTSGGRRFGAGSLRPGAVEGDPRSVFRTVLWRGGGSAACRSAADGVATHALGGDRSGGRQSVPHPATVLADNQSSSMKGAEMTSKPRSTKVQFDRPRSRYVQVRFGDLIQILAMINNHGQSRKLANRTRGDEHKISYSVRDGHRGEGIGRGSSGDGPLRARQARPLREEGGPDRKRGGRENADRPSRTASSVATGDNDCCGFDSGR